MLIALLADLHANREALSASLADARRRGAGRYIFLGDLGYGADPSWVVDQVMSYVERGAVAVKGNHDHALFSFSEQMNPSAQAAIEWTRNQLNGYQRQFLHSLPVRIEEKHRLFVHASASDPTSWPYVLGTQDAEASLNASGANFLRSRSYPRAVLSGRARQDRSFRSCAGR